MDQPTSQPRSPDEAIALVTSHAALSGVSTTERAPLREATGRVLAEPLVTDRASPAVDVSAMDGFAARIEDLDHGPLAIAGEVRIGGAPPSLPPAACLRIVTGGALPDGADMVLRYEDVVEDHARVALKAGVRERLGRGDHIRRQGENAPAGTPLAQPGQWITPAVAAALATFGVATPLLRSRVRVAILSTGDEVKPVTSSVAPWEVRNSNAAVLEAFFARRPWIEVARREHVIDDPDALRTSLGEALASAHAVILTGGVSMGHRDFVPAALAAVGATTLFHRLPQRPGKPILGALARTGLPIIGLPGNPVSVLVTARRIVLPLLARLVSRSTANEGADAVVETTTPSTKTLDLWWHRLVRRVDAGRVELLDARGSGDVVAAAASDGFIETPPNATGAGPWRYFSW